MADPIAAQRQFLIKVNGVEGYFATRTGGETTADAAREWDGGSRTPEVMTGPAMTGDVTIGRPYKPQRDGAVLAKLRPLVGRLRTSVTVQPTDGDLVALGKPTVYTGVLIGLTDPEANAGESAAARLELTFAIERVAS